MARQGRGEFTVPRARPGRHAGWSVAALIAPITAGAFAGAVSWSAGHEPVLKETSTSAEKTAQSATGSTKPAQQPTTSATGVPADQQLAAETERVAALRRQVRILRRQLASATAGADRDPGTARNSTAPTSAPSTRKTTSATTRSSGGSTAAPSTKAPAATTSTEPAAAPTTNATTAAS